MIALVEGAERQKTPNEIALTILLAALTIIFLLAVVALQPMAGYSGAQQSLVVLTALLVCLIPTTIGALLSAIGIAGHGPAGAAQRAGHVRPGRRGRRRHRHPAAGQDRHHHLRQPAGHRAASRRPGVDDGRAGRGGPAVQPGRPDPGGPQHRRAVRHASTACPPRRPGRGAAARVRPVHRADPDDRPRPRDGRQIRKGAGGAVAAWVRDARRRPRRRRSTRPSTRSRSDGGTPLVVAERRRRRGPGARRRRSCPTWSSRACASGSPSCGRWASAR